MTASMMSLNVRATTNLHLVGDDERMPKHGQPLMPRQSLWCYLGIHRWIWMARYQRKAGILYEASYGRCDRPGCTRYPTWERYNVEQVRH